MKYWCRTCKKYFSVRTGTLLQGTHVPLDTWIYAIYLMLSSLKGISSMNVYRELGNTQKNSWYMGHRIREAIDVIHKLIGDTLLDGEVEVDETFIGGKESNRHASKKLRLGRGTVSKKPVIGVKHRESGLIRAKVIGDTTAKLYKDLSRTTSQSVAKSTPTTHTRTRI